MTHKDLHRFQQAEDNGSPSVYDSAIAELTRGRKTGHWIWCVLPQLAGLGNSEMAQRYGIADLAEARAYLANPVLRQRLEAVIAVIDVQLRQPGQSLDSAKAVSSLTLFEAAGLESATAMLDRIGRRCWSTLERLRRVQS